MRWTVALVLLACQSPVDINAPNVQTGMSNMKLLIDLSDSSRSRNGWLSLYSNTLYLAQQEVTAGRFVDVIVVDDGTAGPESQQFIESTLIQNPLVNVTIQGPVASVDLGLLGNFHGQRVYQPSDNWWNLRVDTAPLDPKSAEIITLLKTSYYEHHYVHFDGGGNWGIPYCVVGNETPLVPVTISNASESDKGYPGGPVGYPIPAAAKTDKRYVEAMGNTDGDRHMLIYHRDLKAVFELSYVAWDGSKWTARYGAVFKVDSNYRRTEGWTSTDAAGLCVLAGLVRYDEVYGTEPIRHATRISIKRAGIGYAASGYVWPASHKGSSDAGAPPMGMRFRLKQSVDISGYPAPIKRLLQSWKEYGLIVADRGGNLYVQATLDSRWDPVLMNGNLHKLNADHFEIVKLGWKP